MHHISISSSAVARALALIAFVLVLASIAGSFSKFLLGHDHVKGLVPLFNLDGERNIPAYFSMLLMLIASALLAIIMILRGKQNDSHVSKWGVLCFGFLYMAFDEAFSVHEKLGPLVRSLLGDRELGFFYFAWVIPGIILVILLGLFFLRFLFSLAETARFRFLMAATLYLGGAIGLELIGARHYESLRGNVDWTYSVFTTCEESLEMAGLIVFIWALLSYCAENFKDVRFSFKIQEAAQS